MVCPVCKALHEIQCPEGVDHAIDRRCRVSSVAHSAQARTGSSSGAISGETRRWPFSCSGAGCRKRQPRSGNHRLNHRHVVSRCPRHTGARWSPELGAAHSLVPVARRTSSSSGWRAIASSDEALKYLAACVTGVHGPQAALAAQKYAADRGYGMPSQPIDITERQVVARLPEPVKSFEEWERFYQPMLHTEHKKPSQA